MVVFLDPVYNLEKVFGFWGLWRPCRARLVLEYITTSYRTIVFVASVRLKLLIHDSVVVVVLLHCSSY